MEKYYLILRDRDSERGRFHRYEAFDWDSGDYATGFVSSGEEDLDEILLSEDELGIELQLMEMEFGNYYLICRDRDRELEFNLQRPCRAYQAFDLWSGIRATGFVSSGEEDLDDDVLSEEELLLLCERGSRY